MSKSKLFIYTVDLKVHNSLIINSLIDSKYFKITGIFFSKSLAGDAGPTKKISRIFSYGVLNIMRIEWQYLLFRLKNRKKMNFEKTLIRNVKQKIETKEIKLFRGKDFNNALEKSINCDIVLLIYFNKIIPIWFLNKRKHVYNVHPGKLPEIRGVQPAFWTIRDSKKKAYITIHEVEKTIDTGKIVYENLIEISKNSIYDVLFQLSSLLSNDVEDVLLRIINGNIKTKIQDEQLANYFKRPDKMSIKNFLNAGNRFF